MPMHMQSGCVCAYAVWVSLTMHLWYGNHFLVCACVYAGVYKLVASGPSGTAEKELQLIVVPEGGEAEVTDEVDLTPIPVDGFGAYVAEQHANGNKKFASNYSVSLIHVLILPES